VKRRRRGGCRLAAVCFAGLLLTACASRKDPAQRIILDIESTLTAAASDAATYAPGQLQDVQIKLGLLKTSFDRQDYAPVVTGGPAVLSEAQGLAAAAAAKKAELLRGRGDAWAALAASLPGYAATLQSRVDMLRLRSNRKLAAGVDLDAASAALAGATSLWSKARGAFAAGNLQEAVATAQRVHEQLSAAAALMKVDLAVR
jgi:hypothetical protein